MSRLPDPARAAILGWGSYVPRWRVRAGEVARPRGYVDEDTTTLAVEAALDAVDGRAADLAAVYLSTTRPAYVEKTNAALLHAVLRCPEHVAAYDVNGAARSGVAAFRAAARHGACSLVVMAGTQYGPPGSHEELHGADAAVAFLLGPGDGAARIAGSASLTCELTDVWRLPGERWTRRWDSRFGAQVYGDLCERALAAALADAGRTRDDLAELVISGTNAAAAHAVGKRLGAGAGHADLGDAGPAAWGLGLVDALERADAGSLIALILLADGCEVLLVERTGLARARPTLRDRLAGPALEAGYLDYLTWRGVLERTAQRRPDPAPPAPPAIRRAARWKYGGLHPARPGGLDLHRARGEVREFVIDHVAYAPKPPLVSALVRFDGGEHVQLDLTDVLPAQVARGMRVEGAFRRTHTSAGMHDYFWKVRPAPGEA
ncbi:OB-fold domain-containing protein [Nonomuraea sp. NPDC050540]|uniref:OB-fold domain-containing protein n=1 Tax=Nonomuraea sp. NPDC050540 TaxID=3364367 RepID=UPI0037A16B49